MDIKELREQINEIDEKLVELFLKRMEVSAGVAAYKKERGLPVFDAAREGAVLAAVAEKAVKAGGPLPPESIVNIFRTIMEETRKVEE